MFQMKVVEKITTHILWSITFFENHAIYEITWKNIVQPDRPQTTMWHMHNACSILEDTKTHSEYVKLIAFPW